MHEHYLMLLVLIISYVQQTAFSLFGVCVSYTVWIMRYSRRFEGKMSCTTYSHGGGIRQEGRGTGPLPRQRLIFNPKMAS